MNRKQVQNNHSNSPHSPFYSPPFLTPPSSRPFPSTSSPTFSLHQPLPSYTGLLETWKRFCGMFFFHNWCGAEETMRKSVLLTSRVGRLVDFANLHRRLRLGLPQTRSFSSDLDLVYESESLTQDSVILDFDRLGFGANIEENKKLVGTW